MENDDAVEMHEGSLEAGSEAQADSDVTAAEGGSDQDGCKESQQVSVELNRSEATVEDAGGTDGKAECAVIEEPSSGKADADCLRLFSEKICAIEDAEQRLFSEVRQMHKLYHSEFNGRLKVMNDELEKHRKIDSGRAFDGILAGIAKIYANYELFVEKIPDPETKKEIGYMLMDIEDMLAEYGVERQRSVSGEKWNVLNCRVLKKIPTDDPSKHNTIAKSYGSGFHVGSRFIVDEMVDVFKCGDAKSDDAVSEDGKAASGSILDAEK